MSPTRLESETNSGQLVLSCRRMLSRQTKVVSSGNAVQNAEALYEQNQKKEEISNLTGCMESVVSELNDLLVDACEKEELCGHKPKNG